MPKHLISSFRGGISDEDSKGIAGSFKYGYALDVHKRKDSLSAKQAMATILSSSVGVFGSGAGTTLTNIFNVFVPASDGTTYCFGAQGSIFARSGDGQWNFVYNDENGEIRGAAEWEHSDGANYLYWATATSLARKRLIGADVVPDSGTARWTDATQDYRATLNNRDHFMKMASGQLMIANGESIGTIEFDGDFNASLFNLRPGNLVRTIEERDDYTLAGSGREDGSEEGHLWSFLTTATNYIQKKRIPVKGVNALIYTEIPLLQGGDDGELFFSDFTNTVPLLAVPGGGQVKATGASIENDLAVLGFYGGTYPGIWGYGRRAKNRPMVLSQEYRLTGTVNGSTVSTIGAVAVIDGTLIASWGTTDGSVSEYGVDSVSSTTKATALYESLEFDAGNPQLKKFFNTVKLTMVPLPSGTSVSVKYKLDHQSTWQYAVTGLSSTTFSVTDSTEAEFRVSAKGQIYEVGLELNPSSNSTPEILSVVTDFQPINENG